MTQELMLKILIKNHTNLMKRAFGFSIELSKCSLTLNWIYISLKTFAKHFRWKLFFPPTFSLESSLWISTSFIKVIIEKANYHNLLLLTFKNKLNFSRQIQIFVLKFWKKIVLSKKSDWLLEFQTSAATK